MWFSVETTSEFSATLSHTLYTRFFFFHRWKNYTSRWRKNKKEMRENRQYKRKLWRNEKQARSEFEFFFFTPSPACSVSRIKLTKLAESPLNLCINIAKKTLFFLSSAHTHHTYPCTYFSPFARAIEPRDQQKQIFSEKKKNCTPQLSR